MDRIQAKALIAKVKPGILEKVQTKVDVRHIHGIYRTIVVNGTPQRLLHYPSARSDAPVYFDIHGGGFAWGMMEEGDLLCHHINEQLGFACYSLDYPLCPEAEFPEALYRLYDVIDYLRSVYPQRDFDPDQMVIGGRSAGGNLSAALCSLAKQRGSFQFICQLLDHPALDGAGLLPPDAQGRYTGPEAALNDWIMDGIFSAYVSEADRTNPLCSPLCADDELLTGLPAAVIQTCELDYLRPEGGLYAQRMLKAGVPVFSHCYPGVVHGFTEMEGPDELPGQQYLIDHLRKHLEAQGLKFKWADATSITKAPSE